MNVRGGTSLELASELNRRKVKVGFITGYSRILDLPPELESVPCLLKPFDGPTLERFLNSLLGK